MGDFRLLCILVHRESVPHLQSMHQGVGRDSRNRREVMCFPTLRPSHKNSNAKFQNHCHQAYFHSPACNMPHMDRHETSYFPSKGPQHWCPDLQQRSRSPKDRSAVDCFLPAISRRVRKYTTGDHQCILAYIGQYKEYHPMWFLRCKLQLQCRLEFREDSTLACGRCSLEACM